MQNFKKICMPAKLLLVQNWGKMVHLGPLLEISYIPLLSVMTTLHYHRLYQISSREANLSLEIALCRQKPPSHR